MSVTLTAIDPKREFTGITGLFRVFEACGVIPNWLIQGQLDFVIAIKNNYEFYSGEMGGEVKDGMYTYPGDPDLAPLMEFRNDTQTAYIYPYAIVAVVNDDGKQWITRCD